MTRSCLWFCLLVLGCSAAQTAPDRALPAAAVAPEETPEQRFERALEAFRASQYAPAEAALRKSLGERCCGDAARLHLGELLLLRGRAQEAIDTTQSLASARAVELRARALVALDRAEEAERALTAALAADAHDDAEKRPLLVALGALLIETGRREAAQAPLLGLIVDYNEDRITDEDGPGLFLVARAAELLRSPEDANDAYNLAEQALGHDVELLLARARLFLDNYDPGHAEEVLGEILERAPNHPDALVAMAEVRLEQAMDFGAAKALAREALVVNPTHARAHFVLAGVELRDLQLERALELTATGLEHRPADLPLHGMRAAAQFLADDAAAFEQTRARVFARNAEYSGFYAVVAEYAEWEHRYEKVVEMMREAVAIDPDDAKAHAQLGFNLIRSGQERSGVESLRRAFAKDPFNVRVHNTLNLYEKVVPSEYVSESRGKFEFRYPKLEQPVLSREVPPLVERAWEKMVTSYAYEPETPVGIELYHDRQHFAVRTSGLPQIAIQGVCFGRTLASMTPRNEQFNLGMTLWHELAHVFHIQLSHSHVPRWFTEGLAEYETLVERPEWKRERDAELFVALRAGRLPKVAAMNEAFTHAENLMDVTVAYYASTQIVTMLAEEFGRQKLREMLVAWGRGERHEQVFQGVLGLSSSQLDERFRRFLERRLARFAQQYQPPSTSGALPSLVAATQAEPKQPAPLARLALRQLEEGDLDAAKATLARASKLDAAHPDVLWVQANVGLAEEKEALALRTARRLVELGHDGYEVQTLIARAADPKRELDVFEAALGRAHALDPERPEPLYALLRRAQERKDGSAELRWLRALSPLVEHDGEVQRTLALALLEAGEADAAVRAAEAAVYAEMEHPESYGVLGRVLEQRGRYADAERAWLSATLCPAPGEAIARAHEGLADFYERRGKANEARRERDKARAAVASPP